MHIFNKAMLGEVWAIVLNETEYGYVRVLRGAGVGVYPLISEGLTLDLKLFDTHQPRWFFSSASPPTDNTRMLRVGLIPFKSDEEGWAPPRSIPADIFKKYPRIVEKGFQRRATDNEVKGLERA